MLRLARQSSLNLYNSGYKLIQGDIILTLNIAILEDDQAQSELIESWLLSQEYQTHTYYTGQSLLEDIETQAFDLMLIDWELPDINGPEVMHAIREEHNIETPIIFITSRDSEDDIVSALNAGADDYLVKPVRQFEFLARVKANTKRNQTSTEPIKIETPPYSFNPENEQATLNGTSIELSSKEFELAMYLFSNTGRLLERKEILAAVWRQEADLNTRTVDTHVSVIRKKLAIGPENGWRLKSVYGHGYRLEQLD